MHYLDLEDVLEIHSGQIANYGGSPGLRDLALLESAIAQPLSSFDGKYLHRDIFEMAAAYLFHLVLNHPFVDGNKRVALECALVFFEINAISLDASDDELVELTLMSAQGQCSKAEIAEFFRRVSG